MPEKINKESPNPIDEYNSWLSKKFPSCFSEGKLNFKKLEELLKPISETRDESYSFSWAGRANSIKNIQTPAKTTFVPQKSQSVNFDDTENIFIEGENLEILKLLQKSHFAKIKMIYIDPPYNTGNDFVYNDDFTNNIPSYLEQTGQSKDGIKLTTNPETSGRFHSDWISFMYPRLFLARNLLRDDGIMFISVDDHEFHNLKHIMNEIFGEENFVATIVWEGGLKNDSKFISVSHDYIIAYAKNLLLLKENNTTWRLRKEGIDQIYEKVSELQNLHGTDFIKISELLYDWYSGLDKNNPAFEHRHYNEVDKNGVFFPDNISWPGGGGPKYEILHPVTKKPVKIPSRGWVFAKKEKMLEMINKNRVKFGIDENKVPTIKRYLHETEGQVIPSVIYKDRRNAKKKLRDLFGDDVFDNPKDPEIIQKLITLTCDKEDVVLDFFSGSGSTAQAILDTNVDDICRKFITVQLPEKTNENSIAHKSGYDNIADISKERIRRVIKQIKDTNKQQKISQPKQDLGFKVFKLTKSNYKPWQSPKDESKLKTQLKLFENPLIENYKDLDVIYEVIIKEGYSLNSKIEETNIKSNKIYKISDDEFYFFICLDKQVKQANLESLKLDQTMMFVCLDSALDDSQKSNLNRQCKLKTL